MQPLLSQKEEECLNQIRKAIENNEPYLDVLNIADRLKDTTDLKRFSFMYAGILSARRNKIQDAINLLGCSKDNCVISLLMEFLTESGSLIPTERLFQDPKIYDIHNKTKFYKEFLPNTVHTATSFVKDNPPPQRKGIVTILDIGPGNGYLLAAILNSILKNYSLEKIRLILLEPSQNMLERCITYCQSNVNTEIEFVPIVSRIESLSQENKVFIQSLQPIWFINASASIHHVPQNIKKDVLKNLKSFSPKLLISEFDAYLDLPELDTPQLVYSVITYVTPSFEWVLNDSYITKSDKMALLKQYYLVEVLNMLSKPRADRGDYQATYKEWKHLIEEAGGTVFNKTDTVKIGQRPFTFTLEIGF